MQEILEILTSLVERGALVLPDEVIAIITQCIEIAREGLERENRENYLVLSGKVEAYEKALKIFSGKL